MIKNKGERMSKKNPKNKIQDESPEKNIKNGHKVDHETADKHSKSDIIEQRENRQPRDNT